jgi:hypothetical protein
MDWLKSLAPTVATALLGPLGGAAVSALGDALGISGATQAKIADAIKAGTLTPEQISAIKKMELDYQTQEAERGFKYADLAFRDRDSARQASVTGGTLNRLFWLSLWLISTVLIAELCVLWFGIPHGVPEIIVGRVLGMLDSVAMQVMNFWYGTSSGSAQKTELLAAAPAK